MENLIKIEGRPSFFSLLLPFIGFLIPDTKRFFQEKISAIQQNIVTNMLGQVGKYR